MEGHTRVLLEKSKPPVANPHEDAEEGRLYAFTTKITK